MEQQLQEEKEDQARILDAKADIWAIGSITHYLFLGRAYKGQCPPPDSSDQALPELTGVASLFAREFIQECVHGDPLLRLPAKELMHHRWFKEDLHGLQEGAVAKQRKQSETITMNEINSSYLMTTQASSHCQSKQ